MPTRTRNERMQIMLTEHESAAIDDWRFAKRMPSRAAAIRELIRRGLSADGFALADKNTKSKDFGLIEEKRPKSASKKASARSD